MKKKLKTLTSEKIRLSTTIFPEEWKASFFTEGIKKGDLASQEYETKAGRILVQRAEDPFHPHVGRLLVVEFWKRTDEIFLDPDIYPEGIPEEDKEFYNDCMFGTYVNEVRWHEIIRVYPVIEGMCPCENECGVMYTHDKKQVDEKWCEWKKRQGDKVKRRSH